MMGINRGKQFEDVVKEGFELVPNLTIDRIHDQTNGFKGSSNICDFIAYKKPHIFYLECKSVYGNTLPLTNITDKQWKGLLAKSKVDGAFAGVLCWFIDKDTTLFIPITALERWQNLGHKSLRFDVGISTDLEVFPVNGVKRKVFFDYDFSELIERLEFWREING